MGTNKLRLRTKLVSKTDQGYLVPAQAWPT